MLCRFAAYWWFYIFQSCAETLIGTCITPEKCKLYTGTGPALGQYIATVLGQCWTITGPALGQYSMPVLGQYWANTLHQYWPNAGPAMAQYWANTACRYWATTGPVHCASTGPVLGQHWACIGPVPYASIGPIHSRCAAHVLGQCRLYRQVGIGPVLAQYCHVCWAGAIHKSILMSKG